MVRCKFKVDAIERTIGSKCVGQDESGRSKWAPTEMRSIKMSPVYGNGDPNHENTKFWQASPIGQFTLGTVNLEASEQFELGKEYYIDIESAE